MTSSDQKWTIWDSSNASLKLRSLDFWLVRVQWVRQGVYFVLPQW